MPEPSEDVGRARRQRAFLHRAILQEQLVPATPRYAPRRGEDALPAARRGSRDRQPRPRRAEGARRAHAECAADALRQSQRPDRGRQSLEGLDLHRHRRARRPEPGDQPRGRRALGAAPGRVHRRPGDGRRRRLHRQRPRLPHACPALHRGRQRQHRRHAAAALLLARRGRGAGARADRHLHAQPEGRRLPGRPPDRRRPRAGRHARLQLRLLRRVEEGRPADVEQARLRPRRDPAARRLQDHPDRARQARRPDRRPLRDRQDDDHLHAPERLAAGAGRLRRLDAERPGLRDRERLLRQDLRAQPRGRADDLRRRHAAALVPRERLAARRRARLLRHRATPRTGARPSRST